MYRRNDPPIKEEDWRSTWVDNNDTAGASVPVAVEIRSRCWYGQGSFSFEQWAPTRSIAKLDAKIG